MSLVQRIANDVPKTINGNRSFIYTTSIFWIKEDITCYPQNVSPQLKGPHRSVGVRHPNARGHTEAWESVTPTQGATPKRGSPSPQLVEERTVNGLSSMAKLLHCVHTACILRTQRPGNSPKNTCHLTGSTTKQQSRHENNKTAFNLVLHCPYEQTT